LTKQKVRISTNRLALFPMSKLDDSRLFSRDTDLCRMPHRSAGWSDYRKPPEHQEAVLPLEETVGQAQIMPLSEDGAVADVLM